MPETVEVIEELGVILITSVGKITEHDLRLSRITVKNICQKRGLKKILVDATRQTNRLPTIAAFEHASHLARDDSLGTAKHAIIVLEQTRHDLYFLETAANNRGANLRLFPTTEKALSWLMG